MTRAKSRIGPRRDECEAVDGEMRVERGDERIGVGAREIVDDAGEGDVVASDVERHRIGRKPVARRLGSMPSAATSSAASGQSVWRSMP